MEYEGHQAETMEGTADSPRREGDAIREFRSKVFTASGYGYCDPSVGRPAERTRLADQLSAAPSVIERKQGPNGHSLASLEKDETLQVIQNR
jgi:hypothetical protein